MIEIMAERYEIPLEEIKPLFRKFRKKGILLIVKDQGYTFKLNKALYYKNFKQQIYWGVIYFSIKIKRT